MSNLSFYRWFIIVGSSLLLFFSIFFFMERCIMYDSSYYAFNMLSYKTFNIEHNRYIDVFTQLIPWLMIQTGFKVKDILLAYSVNIALVWLVCSSVSFFLLKDVKTAVLIIISPFLLNSKEFYWMVSEAQFLPAIWLLLLSFVIHTNFEKPTPFRIAAFFILSFIAYTAHPMSLFCMGFFMLIIIAKYGLQFRTIGFILAVFALAFVIKNFVLPVSGYDQSSMGRVKNLIHLFPDYLILSPAKLLIKNFFSQYFIIPLVSLLILILFKNSGKIYWGLFYILSILMFILFINVCFYDLSSKSTFYLENLLQPVVFALLAPFVLMDEKTFSSFHFKAAIVFFIFFGAFRYYFSSEIYTQRLNWERRIIKTYEGENICLSKENAPMDLLDISWCVPFETAVLSAAEFDKTTSLFIYEVDSQEAKCDFVRYYFLNTFAPIGYERLENGLLKYHNTSSLYRKIDSF